MSDNIDADVLMFFVHTAGSPAIAAESTSALAGQDARLMAGFVEGRFFEIDNFTFSIELDDNEGDVPASTTGPGPFARWRSLKPTEPKPNPPFKAEPQDISVTRRIDSSSPVLLQYCLDKKRFDQAVIVKRSRIGSTGMLSAVLRLDFQQVYIRSIDWQDGNTVHETCKFKFGALKATYVKRKPDGTVDTLWPCEWTSQTVKKSRYDV